MPAKQPENNVINFFITEIRTLEFSIMNAADVSFKPENSMFQISSGFEFDGSNDTIAVYSATDIYADDKRTNSLARLVTRVAYKVPKLNNFWNAEKEAFGMPDMVMQTLLSIALSTTRGILTAKTEGTILHTAYLPLLDPVKILEDIKKANVQTVTN